jgi:transcriptional regulator with XRE-family HTH domain
VNAALRKALAASQLTETDVAAHLGVDPKTVRRWLSDQRPYPRHRWALAELLQTEEDTLWPRTPQSTEGHVLASNEQQNIYAHRWQVPRKVWWDLFETAEKEIGILVYSGLFLADDAGIRELLNKKAQNGVMVRILLGNPNSSQVARRGKEEGVGEILAARAKNSLILLRTLLNTECAHIKLHSTALYNSLFFTEKEAIVNHHIYGIPAAEAPAMRLEISSNPTLSQVYIESFQKIWEFAEDTR